ncbi:MAG: hypothetical protein R3Y09_07210 [Clostridia bacterium]
MKDCKACQSIKLYYAILMDLVMEKFKTFSVLDIGIFKICLLSIGLLFGGFFNKFIRKNAILIAIIAIASYAYLIYKIFFKED